MVEAIKPLVRATRRPGADAEIGGFGGLFDLKAAGFTDPILVAANDGVGTKVKIAIETGIHDTIGIDLVAMCVNDIVVQGAEPLFFLDYFATGQARAGRSASPSSRASPRAAGSAGCALIGGETAEMPGLYAGATTISPASRSARPSAARLLPQGRRAPATCSSACPPPGCIRTASRSCAGSSKRRASPGTSPAPFAPGRTLGEALLEPTRIYVKPLLAALKATGGIKALAHITGGGFPDNIPRVLPDGIGVAARSRRDSGAAGFRLARARPAASPRPRCCAPSTAASA